MLTMMCAQLALPVCHMGEILTLCKLYLKHFLEDYMKHFFSLIMSKQPLNFFLVISHLFYTHYGLLFFLQYLNGLMLFDYYRTFRNIRILFLNDYEP